jgi:peptidoglycan/xylan/chitin deacetylase (PgdA/CDA1 family)
VSFRLDDVQPYWCEDIYKTVIDLFIAENIPINLGIIGEYMDESATASSYLNGLAGNPLVEMSSHSFRHQSFENKNYTWQSTDMETNNNMITAVTTEVSNSFIPPRNEYDNTTILAAKANGMNVFSAECTWSLTVPNTPDHCKEIVQVVAPDIMRGGVYMLPTGAVLGGIDYWTDFLLNASLAEAINWVELQIGENLAFIWKLITDYSILTHRNVFMCVLLCMLL